ncbi:MAG: LamB/YcsF family protein [Thermoanaerobaculia bacterium]
MIELSADLGEASDDRDREVERAIWPMIDAANVACGGHAGDGESMREAARNAARLGVIFGAHPSYPDRANFGRKTMRIERDALVASLVEQIETLRSVAISEGVKLQRVKAHGALYNDAHRERSLAEAVVEAVRHFDLSIVAIDSSQMAAVARESGVPVIREVFGDRGYRQDGSLIPRSEPGALLSIEEAAEQAARFANAPDLDTLCIHADTDGAVERLNAIRAKFLLPHRRVGEKVPRSGG